jgi:hypothetical protein
MEYPFFSTEDVIRLEAVYKKLGTLPNNEASFTQIESLFYDVLAIARAYEGTSFSAELKSIQTGLYKKALDRTLTIKMKATAIRRFKHSLRQLLNPVLKFTNNSIA